MQNLDDPEFIPIGCCYQDIYYNVRIRRRFSPAPEFTECLKRSYELTLIISMEEEVVRIMERPYSM